MTARSIDGTAVARRVREDVARGVEKLVAAGGVAPGERVLVVDDVLATGGTVDATRRLVEAAGGEVAVVAVLMDLSFLPGREALGETPLLAEVSPRALRVMAPGG